MMMINHSTTLTLYLLARLLNRCPKQFSLGTSSFLCSSCLDYHDADTAVIMEGRNMHFWIPRTLSVAMDACEVLKSALIVKNLHGVMYDSRPRTEVRTARATSHFSDSSMTPESISSSNPVPKSNAFLLHLLLSWRSLLRCHRSDVKQQR